MSLLIHITTILTHKQQKEMKQTFILKSANNYVDNIFKGSKFKEKGVF